MLLQMLRKLYLALVNTTLVRYGVLPTSADTVAAAAVLIASAGAAWTWGAWTQIAATVGTADLWLYGYSLENFVGAASQGEIQIGFGTAPLGTALVTIQSVVAGAGLPRPIRVPAGLGVVARYRTSTGAADSVDIKLNTMSGISA